VFRWAFVFLIVTFLAGIFAFAGLVLAAAALAKLIFYLFLVLFLLALIAGLLEKIALREYDVFTGKDKVGLTVREKLGILAKGFLKRLS